MSFVLFRSPNASVAILAQETAARAPPVRHIERCQARCAKLEAMLKAVHGEIQGLTDQVAAEQRVKDSAL